MSAIKKPDSEYMPWRPMWELIARPDLSSQEKADALDDYAHFLNYAAKILRGNGVMGSGQLISVAKQEIE